MSEAKPETRRQIQDRINTKLDAVGSRSVHPNQAIALHQGVLNTGESREATYDEQLSQYVHKDPDVHKKHDFFYRLRLRKQQKKRELLTKFRDSLKARESQMAPSTDPKEVTS